MNVKNRTLFIGDNLDVMRGINSEIVDLIYLDPPFNSNRTYEAPIGSEAAGAAFKDSWTLSDVDLAWHGLIAEQDPALASIVEAAGLAHSKGMQAYLTMMAVRLIEMRRLLKRTGTVYLHCDPTASHYLKLLMDCVFGAKNFRNEISWCYRGGGVPKYDFARKHDTLLRYSKTSKVVFNVDEVRIAYSSDSSDRLQYTARAFRSSGVYENYQPNPKGKHPEDWWQIQPIMPSSKERIGYPTQKPLKLLERIIKASSNEGDLVFDPFCGCATALVTAETFNRKWVGIDLSSLAAKLVKSRLRRGGELFYEIHHRTDIPCRTDVGTLPPYKTHKHTLYGKQEGKCQGCRYHFPFRNLTVDHIVPQSRGGTDHIDNLQLLCSACNSTKGTMDQAAFIARITHQGIRE